MAMLLGELLVTQGLVTRADIDAALARQNKFGGRIGENLIAMGKITRKALDGALVKQYEVVLAILRAEDVLARSERINGHGHPQTHRQRWRLARALVAGGRLADALKLAQTALAGHEDTLGRWNAWTKESAQLVAEILAALGHIAASDKSAVVVVLDNKSSAASPRQRPAVAARVRAGEQHAGVIAADDLDAARAV
jgi:hypothetical protein